MKSCHSFNSIEFNAQKNQFVIIYKSSNGAFNACIVNFRIHHFQSWTKWLVCSNILCFRNFSENKIISENWSKIIQKKNADEMIKNKCFSREFRCWQNECQKLHGVKNETFIISTFGKVISESIYLIKCIERKTHWTTLVLWLMSKHEAN